jgi:transcriptional regulator
VSAGSEVLVLFTGPEQYVSPGWYPSKQEDARVVPTWNYMMVQARGRITWIHERDWLEALLNRLTATFEAARETPWQLTDAPREFLDRMLGGIVGLEIGLTELRGKWKLSQNRGAADRLGVVSALEVEAGSGAAEMAAQMRALGLVPPRDA